MRLPLLDLLNKIDEQPCPVLSVGIGIFEVISFYFTAVPAFGSLSPAFGELPERLIFLTLPLLDTKLK
jgi:hypothetical protein